MFWECGGTLAAPTISSGVIHKLMAFVAPKIIGGVRAPTPVGELGFVEMTQAVQLADTTWRQVRVQGARTSCCATDAAGTWGHAWAHALLGGLLTATAHMALF